MKTDDGLLKEMLETPLPAVESDVYLLYGLMMSCGRYFYSEERRRHFWEHVVLPNGDRFWKEFCKHKPDPSKGWSRRSFKGLERFIVEYESNHPATAHRSSLRFSLVQRFLLWLGLIVRARG